MVATDVEQLLSSIYYKPNKVGSFGNVVNLYRAVNKNTPGVKLREVKKWLSGQETYGVHFPFRKKFHRSRVVVKGIDYMWDVDLMDMTLLARFNAKIKYVMLVIDDFSRYVWVFPMKDKTGVESVKQFHKLFYQIKRKPKYLRSDKGKEFVNKNVKLLLQKTGVKHIVTQTEVKAAFAERAIKTIKSKLYKYMFHNQTYKYLNVLNDFVDAYNHTVHHSLRLAPSDVNKNNEKKLWWKLYVSDVRPLIRKYSKSKNYLLNEGDYVRVSFLRGAFAREYREKWSAEIFQVFRRRARDGIYVYWIRDLGGEEVLGSFYREELQPVDYNKDGLYKIEKVIKTKRDKQGSKWYFVKWLNWGDKFSSWVRERDITRLK